MLEILGTIWTFLLQVSLAGWDLLVAAATFCGGLLYHLHVDAPRLEGLVVGVVLAWVMLRRDRHPLLRVLSSPLKLILDILDLAWDACVEVVGDLWVAVRDWVQGVLGWCWNKVTGTYNWCIDGLKSLKNKLSKSSKE